MTDKILEIMNQYKINKSKTIKEPVGNWIKISTLEFTLNNNETIMRDVLTKPHTEAIIVIPKTIHNKYLMVIQPRPSTDINVTIEFPAGYVEDNESIIDGAKRELLEETGYSCKNIEIINTYYQDVACSNAKITLLIANGCEKTNEQNLDESEMITYIELTYDEIMEILNNNLIKDANSILGIYYLNSKENRD